MSVRAGSFVASALLVLLAAPAGAAGDAPAKAPVPQDYAFGMTFDTQGVAAAFRSELPLEVYQGITRADLVDLAVFNARNEVVPHVIEHPRTTSTVRQPPVSFAVFPLRGNERAAIDAVRISIEAGGAKIEVQAPAGPQTAVAEGTAGTEVNGAASAGIDAAASITSYILDGRALPGAISAMQIGWPDDAPQFAGRLKVEGSDDLGYWQTLVDSAPIANLRAGDSRLVERRVETRLMRSKFWRLSWVGERAPFEITSVTAEPAGNRHDIGRPALTLAGVPVTGKAGEFEFDLGSHFPVDRVNLELPELNSIVEVQLFSRATSKAPWLPVTRSGFYRLKSASAELVNGDVTIAPNTDRYWLARVDVRGNGLGAGNPKLRIAWPPHDIVFLARGEGPFKLAFGNASQVGSTAGRIPSLPTGAHVLYAPLGKRETLGGESRRSAEVSSGPSRSAILWVVLGLAVALLAYMAFRLAKDLKPKA